MAKGKKVVITQHTLLEEKLYVTIEVLDDPKFDFYIIDALYLKDEKLVGSLRQIIHKEPPPGPFPQRCTLSEY